MSFIIFTESRALYANLIAYGFKLNKKSVRTAVRRVGPRELKRFMEVYPVHKILI